MKKVLFNIEHSIPVKIYRQRPGAPKASAADVTAVNVADI